MTTLPPSGSSQFQRLHPRVQRWVWLQQWQSLRPIQEQAIPLILRGDTDLIIAAATAGGKTEAAFLPIFSRLMALSQEQAPASGIQALCLSPLKALINDQHHRLSELGDLLEIPVTPWHGDSDAGRKQRLLAHPQGILLITPESLEALFIRQGPALGRLFHSLAYVVVDELHAFIGSERGKQLQSLMHRVEQVVRRSVPRIGLSATLGDMTLAAEFLRWGKADGVALIQSQEEGQTVQIQVRGYRLPAPVFDPTQDEDQPAVNLHEAVDRFNISAHLFKVLRGSTNLIFINSRALVEEYTDRLLRLCDEQRLPREFWPHHGSLSKEIRHEAEQALKRDKPANIICTTTLEMGIDIGSVTSIAQVGAPFSVSSTRQRLGRSGRNLGDPAIIRFYISEREVTSDTLPQDALHPALVQTIAIVNLMVIDRWCEPPVVNCLHLSTLIQQVLSLIAQYSGVNALQLWQVLCQTGAFHPVGQRLFMQLLRQLGEHDLIQQTQDGSLILGIAGEKLVNHYHFYTAFKTPEEYRIVARGRTLGTLPIDVPLVPGILIIFAGKRWQVVSVDFEHKVVDVEQASAGQVPIFSGSGGSIHDRLRQEMYRIYRSEAIPAFLDRTARALLQEARDYFMDYALDHQFLLPYGRQTLLFCWQGSQVVNTIALLLHQRGLTLSIDGMVIVVNNLTPITLLGHLRAIVKQGPAEASQLAEVVNDKVIEKHDGFLDEDLLCANYASSHLDTQGAWETLRAIVAGRLRSASP